VYDYKLDKSSVRAAPRGRWQRGTRRRRRAEGGGEGGGLAARAAARAAAAAGTMRATMTCSCERDGMTAAAGFSTVFQWLGR